MTDFRRVKEALPLKGTILSLTGLRMAGPHLERCPFCGHQDCFSFKDDGFRCFSCDAKGDVINFIERYKGLPPKEALESAAALAGIALSPRPAKDAKHVGQPPSVRDKIFATAADYYHANALNNGGREYFVETRKRAERVLAAEKVGWSDGRLHEHLLGLGFSIIDCVECGLVKIDGEKNKDAFYPGCALFPQLSQGRILHISKKDPKSKTCSESEKAWRKAQLRKEYRDKDWIAYGQDALYRKGEIVIVEGEHDRLSLLEAGLDSVIATVGNPSAENFKRIVSHCAGRHVYLCFDNDTGGKGYTRMFARALMAEGAVVRIMVFDGAKDIDEYLGGLAGDRRREVKRLQGEAVDLVTWEIRQAALLDGLEARYKHLKENGVFKAASAMGDMERDIFIEKVRGLGFSLKATEEAMETEDELMKLVLEYYESIGGRKNASSSSLAEIIYGWFRTRGKFFKTGDGRVCLFYNRRIYEIGDNLDFNTLLGTLTMLAPAEAPGKLVWHWLRVFCNDRAEMVPVMGWLYTDREKDIIYTNLNSPRNTIMKLAPGKEPEVVPNGINADGVLLDSSPDILPFRYNPNTSESEALSALREHIFENLSCELEQRYLILCWIIYAFFLDYNKTKGNMHFTGSSRSGKTTAAALLAYLLYGEDTIGVGSVPSSTSEAARSPMIVLDNVENKNLKEGIITFLLLGANSATKRKRKTGSDTDTIKEKIKALILITAIEHFPGHLLELITRTFEVEFDKNRFGNKKGFMEDFTYQAIVAKRDMMLSGIMKVVTKEILPRMNERVKWLAVLEKNHPGHNKDRANEFLTLMLVILEALVKYIPYEMYASHPLAGVNDARLILDRWIEYQDSAAAEIGTSSNTLLNLLDGCFISEYDAEINGKDLKEPMEHPMWPGKKVFSYRHSEYHIPLLWTPIESFETVDEEGREMRMRRKEIQVEASAAELHAAFSKYCRNTGTKNPYDNPTALGCRIKNDIKFVEGGGWKLIGTGDTIFIRKVHNTKIYRFRKELSFY